MGFANALVALRLHWGALNPHMQPLVLLSRPRPIVSPANPTWGDIFETSKLEAQTSLLPRFSEKRRWSLEL